MHKAKYVQRDLEFPSPTFANLNEFTNMEVPRENFNTLQVPCCKNLCIPEEEKKIGTKGKLSSSFVRTV